MTKGVTEFENPSERGKTEITVVSKNRPENVPEKNPQETPGKVSEAIIEKGSTKVTPAKEDAKTDTQNVNTNEQVKKRGQGLRPIYLADGKTEVTIDPNTGARIFEIK